LNELRYRIGISLQELEISLLQVLRKSLATALESCLNAIDDWIKEERNRDRYEIKERKATTIETILGEPVTFSRRYYLDKQTGKYVFLLDEVLGLPKETEVSPALAELILHQVALTPSYRAAAASLEKAMGKRVVSHETVRQIVKSAGLAMEEGANKENEEVVQKKRVGLLFLEVDALHVSLQRDKKRTVPEYVCTIHGGWKPRTPGSKDYKLKKIVQIRAQTSNDLWERVSSYLYSHYEIKKDTVIVINGDRASWIRRGIELFPNALYQADRYHVKRDLRRIFGGQSELCSRLEEALDSDDVTGATFLAELAESKLKLKDPEKATECQKLLNDLVEIADATVDYRKRLEARRIPVEGLRGLGAGESQMSYFASRVKGKRSWSRDGLAAMMELLSWRNTGRLRVVTENIVKFLRNADLSWNTVKELAQQATRRVLPKNVYVPPIAGVPMARAGRTSSGGLSNLFNRLNEGTTF
jgi:hypothetical protein